MNSLRPPDPGTGPAGEPAGPAIPPVVNAGTAAASGDEAGTGNGPAARADALSGQSGPADPSGLTDDEEEGDEFVPV
jgi:hypothetical protein